MATTGTFLEFNTHKLVDSANAGEATSQPRTYRVLMFMNFYGCLVVSRVAMSRRTFSKTGFCLDEQCKCVLQKMIQMWKNQIAEEKLTAPLDKLALSFQCLYDTPPCNLLDMFIEYVEMLAEFFLTHKFVDLLILPADWDICTFMDDNSKLFRENVAPAFLQKLEDSYSTCSAHGPLKKCVKL